jgi:hypothetical protein
MKRVSAIALMLCLLFVAGAANAQLPFIMVYYDDYYTIGNKDCPSGVPGTTIDSVFVVAQQINKWFTAVEYSITYPPQMTYLSEMVNSDLTIGNTVSGIAQTWSFPVNGYQPALLNKVYFLWNCDGCTATNRYIVVTNHPLTSHLRGVEFGSNELFNIIGMTSVVCGTTPVEDTTWGNIKALYEQ